MLKGVKGSVNPRVNRRIEYEYENEIPGEREGSGEREGDAAQSLARRILRGTGLGMHCGPIQFERLVTLVRIAGEGPTKEALNTALSKGIGGAAAIG